MRSFTFIEGTSNKFWNIDLQGKQFTVTFGKIGTNGQTQVKAFADDAVAKKEHDKLVAEKLKKGYTETITVPEAAKPQPKDLGEALVMALVENPDDVASHMAYADYLEEQGDPRGELIRVGLALEDASRSPAERKKLQAREKKLIAEHKDVFFGELVSLMEHKEDTDHPPEWEHTLRRGWIDSLKLDHYKVEHMRLVARAPELRLLRRLDLGQPSWDDDAFEPGDDIPAGTYHPQLFPLARATNLANVREFLLGDEEAREGMDDLEYGTSCHTPGEGVLGIIKQMPKVEELHLYAHHVDTTQLFGLKTLDHLRVLRVYHNQNYPLAVLAKNPSLGRLTHFLTHPHALEDERPYIRTPAVKALVNSPTLPALTHLQLRLSDMGDKGVKEIVASGVLARLKVLDLQHGCVSDKGAEMIAKCPDAKKLERLDLTHNALTPAGVAALEAAGVKVQAARQWVMNEGETLEDWAGEGDGFLFAGDIE